MHPGILIDFLYDFCFAMRLPLASIAETSLRIMLGTKGKIDLSPKSYFGIHFFTDDAQLTKTVRGVVGNTPRKVALWHLLGRRLGSLILLILPGAPSNGNPRSMPESHDALKHRSSLWFQLRNCRLVCGIAKLVCDSILFHEGLQ